MFPLNTRPFGFPPIILHTSYFLNPPEDLHASRGSFPLSSSSNRRYWGRVLPLEGRVSLRRSVEGCTTLQSTIVLITLEE